jgi:hypothetical protein
MNIRKALLALGFDYKQLNANHKGGKITKAFSANGLYSAYRNISVDGDRYKERLDVSCVVDGTDVTVTMWQHGCCKDLVNNGDWTDGNGLLFSKTSASPASESTEIHAGEMWIPITRIGAMKAIQENTIDGVARRIERHKLPEREEEYGFMDYDV